ncbi:sensor histidine kinase [Actinopolymorpha singaporensis]|uniref:sensor histidine kinase n=1 Tax=Actinopolymorpha singaporensis TaxID=117157 RepID=UPI0018D4CFD2|nr:HAMP domain-containing sensor histidine kinase [Actinopolymorpha singaporensis]
MPDDVSAGVVLRPTLRMRMALLYAALICTSVVAILGSTYLLAPGLLVHRTWQPAPNQPAQATGTATTGHSSGVFAESIGSDKFGGLLMALAVIAAFSLALSWLIAGRFVRPLRAIIGTAQDISANDLHRRLGLHGRHDEFTQLGETLDDLFARLEASFEAQRHFIANASHELRTPLSAGRALLQVAITDPAPTVETLRATCEELLQLGEQQERLIAALLTLANSQRGQQRPQPLDLADVARTVLLTRGPEAERRRVRLDVALTAAPATGDPSLVQSLVTNLVDNALRHNVPNGHAEIRTATGTAGAVLSVANTGTIVPAIEVEHLFEPFRQLGTERIRHSEGHGLGLAIVRAITHAHGATLTAHARPKGGLDIQVVFPTPSALR